MRLHLVLRPIKQPMAITLSYGYSLSCAIYRWIEASSREYSTFLHDEGFHVEGTRQRFKHFCFSQLMVRKRRVENGLLHILSPTVDWYIGMPVETSLQHLVVGMFERREFYVGREENRFVVEQVETLPNPVEGYLHRGITSAEGNLHLRMKFRLLSPLTSSVSVQRNGKLMPYYLPADDSRLSEALRTNLLNKYNSLYSRSTSLVDLQGDTEFRCTLDEKFIADRGGPEKISKLITIKQGRPDETKVRGFMCPLTIEGDPALIALAYDSGLGEKNSLGFGMLELM